MSKILKYLLQETCSTLEPNRHLSLICIVFFATEIQLAGVVYGQELEINSTFEKSNITKVEEISPLNNIEEMDILLEADLSASLAGLALAAAAFLFGYKPESIVDKIMEFEQEKHNRSRINQAKKDFIYSFFSLIACTITIFGFDIFEANITPQDLNTYADAASKYILFGAGLLFLGKGATNLYRGVIGVRDARLTPTVMSTERDFVAEVKQYISNNRNCTVENIAIGRQINDKEVELIVKELKESHQVKEFRKFEFKNLKYKKTYIAVNQGSQ